MTKRIISLLLAMVMSMSLLAGCGSKPAENENNEVQQEQQGEQSTAVTVTDAMGNTVTLEKPAEKVVTCFYGTSYAMIALGISDKVVGMEAKANSRPIYGLAAPAMLELPNVGSMKEFNVESAIGLEPDVVILPKKLQDTASTFAEVGIPVAIWDAETQESLENMLTMIGALCGVPEKAEALIKYYDDTFAKVADLTKDLKEEDKPSVYMAGNSSYLQTAPKAMYQATLIENAGGINAAAGIDGNYWVDVAYEQIIDMNPDVIIFDEATSALDNESEAIVQKAIDNLMQDKTVFVIAHRLSTIRNADLIVVLENGKIVEKGSYTELKELNGKFSELERLSTFTGE